MYLKISNWWAPCLSCLGPLLAPQTSPSLCLFPPSSRESSNTATPQLIMHLSKFYANILLWTPLCRYRARGQLAEQEWKTTTSWWKWTEWTWPANPMRKWWRGSREVGTDWHCSCAAKMLTGTSRTKTSPSQPPWQIQTLPSLLLTQKTIRQSQTGTHLSQGKGWVILLRDHRGDRKRTFFSGSTFSRARIVNLSLDFCKLLKGKLLIITNNSSFPRM